MIQVRTAKIRDGKSIAQLHLDMMTQHESYDPIFAIQKNAQTIAEDWFSKMPRRRNHRLWVAELDNKIIGYLWVKITERPPIFKEMLWGEIVDVHVARPFRRQGVSKKLMNIAFEWLVTKKIKTASLYVATENDVAQQAWKSFKFKEYFKKMYRPLND